LVARRRRSGGRIIRTVSTFNIGDLAKPVEKLIEVIERGIGGVLRPWQIVRVARAEAEASKIRALAEREVAAFPALPAAPGDASTPVIEAELVPEGQEEPIPLMRRAETRLLYREGQRQLNLENIARAAHQNIGDEVSDEPVDDDWVTRFFEYAKDVSAREMQELWGRILAGEVRRPGAFSLRCLDTVRSLSRREAEMFRTICTYVVMGDSIFKAGTPALIVADVRVSTFLALCDAGLMSPGTQIGRTIQTDTPGEFDAGFSYHDLYIRLRRPNPDPVDFEVFNLTAAGRELFTVAAARPSRAYLSDLVDLCERRGFRVSVHRRTARGFDSEELPVSLAAG
jgi:hypothetical protein